MGQVSARVVWLIHQGGGSELATLDVSYMIRARADGERIVAFIDHDEEQRLSDRGLHRPGATPLFELPRAVEQRPRTTVSGRIAV